jgi:hypothetical protein
VRRCPSLHGEKLPGGPGLSAERDFLTGKCKYQTNDRPELGFCGDDPVTRPDPG